MSLAATVKIATHFTAHEAGIDVPEATDSIIENARHVAQWLEGLRAIMNEDVPTGAPARKIIVTSWFRPPVVNAAAGGADTSDHLQALAVDFEVTGLSPYDVYTRLQTAAQRNRLPAFDQLIWYAIDNHIHVGLGPRMRRQILFKTAEGSYRVLAGELVQRLRGYV